MLLGVERDQAKSGRTLGTIVSVSGSQAIMRYIPPPENQQASSERLSVGKFIKIVAMESRIIGFVSSISVPLPETDNDDDSVHIVELYLIGEILLLKNGKEPYFQRGVTEYPSFGDRVHMVAAEDLEVIYSSRGEHLISVGSVQQDGNVKAVLKIDHLLSKHFAVLGTTGVGKSCALALMLQRILGKMETVRVFLIDPHNEYRNCFGKRAEVVSPKDVNLPFWMFNFEEIVDVFFQARPGIDEEVELLSELIPQAKIKFALNQRRAEAALMRRDDRLMSLTVDTPVPYRISDVIAAIDNHLGKLENRSYVAKYKRLKARIESVSQDPRYRFMFGNLTIDDTMGEVLGRLFRVPINGKPITIMELAGFPSEVVDAVVSVLCRMAFDFGVWSEGKVPLLVVAEEAHRYVPADKNSGFGPTRRSLARIAKEGRKYGVFLGVVTQRPSELDPTILSQCSTILAMRMSNDRDQEIVRSAVSDTAAGMIDFLPSLGSREAIAFGEGVSLPMRLKFDELDYEHMPHSQTGKLDSQSVPDPDASNFMHEVIRRWRSSIIQSADNADDELPGHEDEYGEQQAMARLEPPVLAPEQGGYGAPLAPPQPPYERQFAAHGQHPGQMTPPPGQTPARPHAPSFGHNGQMPHPGQQPPAPAGVRRAGLDWDAVRQKVLTNS